MDKLRKTSVNFSPSCVSERACLKVEISHTLINSSCNWVQNWGAARVKNIISCLFLQHCWSGVSLILFRASLFSRIDGGYYPHELDGGRALRNGSCRYKHRWDAAVRLTSSEETETDLVWSPHSGPHSAQTLDMPVPQPLSPLCPRPTMGLLHQSCLRHLALPVVRRFLSIE